MEIPIDIQRRIDLRESFLLSYDMTFIGKLSLNRFDSESISNNFGIYGSKFSAFSICNIYSQYGSKFSILSINNPYTQTPPFIILRGQIIGRLSKNRFLQGFVLNPDNLISWMHQNYLV